MTNTMRVDVCYRPLRIGWAVREGDMTAIRQAIKYSHALWGGRFNPILIVDREEEARQLVELFRLDLIMPLGDSPEVKNFPSMFPHLITPFPGDSVFVKDEKWKSFAHVLDISNTLSHWYKKPDWKHFKDAGLRAYKWQPNDPLADVFLMQLGAYPSADEVGVNYAEMVGEVLEPISIELVPTEHIPSDILEHPSFASIGTFGMERHYSVRTGWDSPGIFVGDASDPDDLVCYWNLRASDIPLWFVDLAMQDRYIELIPEWTKALQRSVEHRRHEWDRRLGIWSRKDIDEAAKIIAEIPCDLCQIRESFWSGGAVIPPMMFLDETSTLGVMGESQGTPRVSFALSNKPFDSDVHFNNQHLVASISFIGGLYGDEQHTFDAPYIPELNEFYARSMHFNHSKLRVEPERIGMVISATDHDNYLTALTTSSTLQKIFSLAGFDSKLSSSGRIVRQIITQLGGLQGARVFKVPGARKLLKKFGPRDTFTSQTANQIIADKVQGRGATIAAHAHLYIQPRPAGITLTPAEVFNYMVEKGLFRMGVNLDCSKCGMASWTSLDDLKQQASCELCGNSYDATRQLLDSKWSFRRSGLMGSERNTQGAVPVALTLQQLDTTLGHGLRSSIYCPSLDLRATGNSNLPNCEVDFVWLINEHRNMRSSVILAECKDQGPINPEEFQRDVDNMRRVADAFPKHRFDVYVLFVKLAPFTAEEIDMARTLNGPYRHRVILLTARELEPYYIHDRLKEVHGINSYVNSPKDLANVTTQLYFNEPKLPQA